MEQRLKERLTGAAILVALIVLIVPELFRGHLSERAGAPGSSDGPPLRSYLIDLGGSHSSPMQLGATSARTLTAAPAVSAPMAAPEPATAIPSAPATPSPVPTSSPPSAPATAETAAASPTAHRPSAPARATPSVAVKSIAHGGSSGARARAGDWSVQLGLYAKRSNAEHMVHVAHTKGFLASLTKPDAKGRYHVRVAGASTRSAALTLAARLRAAGLPAAAVGPR